MLNPIEEMRKLSLKSYDELLRMATSVCGFCPNGKRYSKVELITYIVSNAAIRSYFGDRLNNAMTATTDNSAPNRTRYRFREMDGTEHYVMLTPEQERFMQWNADNAIDYDTINIDFIEDIDWEKP